MKLQHQVCSVELGKMLSDFGLWNNTLEHYQRNGDWAIRMVNRMDIFYNGITYPAYTVAELGVMLGDEVTNIRPAALSGWMGFGEDLSTGLHRTEADCRAEYLALMLERKRTTVEKCNHLLITN